MKYLISIADVKALSVINTNVDDTFVSDAIEEAQQLYLRPILGDELYEKLLEGITVNGFALDNDYYNLVVDYIHPYLKRQIEANICITLNYKLRNIGVVSNTDDHCTLPSYKELMSVEQKYKDTASAYASLLVKHLCENRDKFPEYSVCRSNPNTDTIIYLN